MRRMLLPEVKIKSKLKDDIMYISIEELLTHAHINYPDYPSIKSLIIQPVVQEAGEEGGIYINDSNLINTEITNSTVTITYVDPDNLIINGLGINIVIDLSSTNIEDVNIVSEYYFDVYIIKL